MPGHKGNHFHDILSVISRYDITEINGADVLCAADGIIDKSENFAASIFNSKHTLYSAGGSTLAIQTMLSCVTHSRGEKIIAGRNAHVAFINSCVLLDIVPVWVVPEGGVDLLLGSPITATDIEKAIVANPDAKAVYVTSPDYLGVISDLEGISKVCRRYGIPLLVDNAHGSHLAVLDDGYTHPIRYADLCCDSPHKTLPVLTGGAYLHIGKGCPIDKSYAKKRMALFSSTSPSYLILLSLDLCNEYLAKHAYSDYSKLKQQVKPITDLLKSKGQLNIPNSDFTKVSIDCFALGYTGEELADLLSKANIEPEYAGHRYVILMLSPFNRESDLELLYNLIYTLPARPAIEEYKKTFFLPKSVLPPRPCYFLEKQTVLVENLADRLDDIENGKLIAAENVFLCPPGIPILVVGEEINNNSLNLLKNYSIFSIDVVK